MAIGHSAYFWWEVEESERLPETTRDVCMETSERLDGGKGTSETKYQKKDCASEKKRLAA